MMTAAISRPLPEPRDETIRVDRLARGRCAIGASGIVTASLALVLTACSTQSGKGVVVDTLDARVWCLHERENGELWFGSNGSGVFRRISKQLIQYTAEHGLPGNDIRNILSDGRDGVLVVANDGVSRFDGESFATLEVERHEGRDGWELNPEDVWFVVEIGAARVCRFDGRMVHELDLPESSADGPKRSDSDPAWFHPRGVYHVSTDRRGHVWIGTAAAGLCRFDGDSIDWMYEPRLTTTPDGGEFGIRSVFQDRDGAYWICNTRQRFAMQAEGRNGLLGYTAKPGLPDASSDGGSNFTYFHDVVETGDGDLWMACGSDGVLHFDGSVVRRHALAPGSYAVSILVDRTDTVWVGTLENGAYRFGEGGFRRL